MERQIGESLNFRCCTCGDAPYFRDILYWFVCCTGFAGMRCVLHIVILLFCFSGGGGGGVGPLRFKGLGYRGTGSCEVHTILLRIGYTLY